MTLTWAGQAEILRAAEKDQQHIDSNYEALRHGLCNVLGVRNVMPYQHGISTGSSLAYYALASVLDIQTLGEQFVNIVRCTPEGKPVSFLRRLLLLIEYVPWRVRDVELQNIFTIATRLHLIHFYLFGEYASISKRLAGSRYALFRKFLDMSHLSWIFKAIGYMYIAKMLRDLHAKTTETSAVRSERLKEDEKSQLNCAMCNDSAAHCTLTPCGHVFCWDCIAKWVWSHRTCASCRKSVEPEKLIRVLNR